MTFLYILLALVLFGILITLHELGHFLVARLFKVTIHEFSVGFGPAILTRISKKTGTRYSLRVIPIGGYVSMLGEDEAPESRKYKDTRPEPEDSGDAPLLTDFTPGVSEDTSSEDSSGTYIPDASVPPEEPSEDRTEDTSREGTAEPEGETAAVSKDPGNYQNKKVWQRALISIAGPVTNLLLGFLCMLVVVILTPRYASTIVADFTDKATSNQEIVLEDGSKSGTLMPGDRIVKVGNTSVHTGNEVAYEIMYNAVRPIDITVIRDGTRVRLANVVFPTFEDEQSGATFGDYDFYILEEAKTFGSTFKHAFFQSVSTVKMVLDSLSGLFTGRFGIRSVSGPVGITKTIADAASTSFYNVLYLFTVITINLGVMNLLPVPALDGSKLLFLAIEGIRGKPVSKKIEGYIHLAGMAVLLLLMLLITFKDIRSLF